MQLLGMQALIGGLGNCQAQQSWAKASQSTWLFWLHGQEQGPPQVPFSAALQMSCTSQQREHSSLSGCALYLTSLREGLPSMPTPGFPQFMKSSICSK